MILYFCLQSSTPSTPSSSFASPATSAPRTTGPVRVAGFDALLKTAGVDDEEDADFSHLLGSAAAAPGPAAPSLKRRRDSLPGFYAWPVNDSDGVSDSDLSSGPMAMTTHVASHFLMGAAVPSVPSRVAACVLKQAAGSESVQSTWRQESRPGRGLITPVQHWHCWPGLGVGREHAAGVPASL